MKIERRINRSDNIYKALQLQLTASMKRANFNSMILAEDQGFPIAGVGQMTDGEEVAALAPGLVPGRSLWQGKIALNNGPEKTVTIAPLLTEAGYLYLCSVGGDASKILSELQCSSIGVHRILV